MNVDAVTVGQAAEGMEHGRSVTLSGGERPDAMDGDPSGGGVAELHEPAAGAAAAGKAVGLARMKRGDLGQVGEKVIHAIGEGWRDGL